MRRLAFYPLLLLTLAGTMARSDDPNTKEPIFMADGITITIDNKLRTNWEFSNFKRALSFEQPALEGIAYNRGGRPFLRRWYGYDKDDVKIIDGPLGYQDYPVGEKTRFEMILGDKVSQIKRIKIAAQ